VEKWTASTRKKREKEGKKASKQIIEEMPKEGFLPSSLPDLGRRLCRDGPLRILAGGPTRRVRILFAGGRVVADSGSAGGRGAMMVWEHEFYPAWYLPLGDFEEGVLTWEGVGGGDGEGGGGEGKDGGLTFAQATLSVRDGTGRNVSTDRVLVFFSASPSSAGDTDGGGNEDGGRGQLSRRISKPSSSSATTKTTMTTTTPSLQTSPGPGALDGLVRVEFSAVEAWLEEDERIYVHPKDPFKRVDIVRSSRSVRVFVDADGGVAGKVQVAAALGGGWWLYETGLPVRFYLPLTSVLEANGGRVGGGTGDVGNGVKQWYLRPSDTTTECPYKGVANYYDIVLLSPGGEVTTSGAGGERGGAGGETVLKDVVWYYRNPTVECAVIMGAICFYNEKVDIELDGQMLERPLSVFS